MTTNPKLGEALRWKHWGGANTSSRMPFEAILYLCTPPQLGANVDTHLSAQLRPTTRTCSFSLKLVDLFHISSPQLVPSRITLFHLSFSCASLQLVLVQVMADEAEATTYWNRLFWTFTFRSKSFPTTFEMFSKLFRSAEILFPSVKLFPKLFPRSVPLREARME